MDLIALFKDNGLNTIILIKIFILLQVYRMLSLGIYDAICAADEKQLPPRTAKRFFFISQMTLNYIIGNRPK